MLAHSPSVGGAELALANLMESTADTHEWHIVFPCRQEADPKLTKHAHGISYLELPWWCYEQNDTPKKINKSNLLNNLSELAQLARSADILLTNTITIPWLGFIAKDINKPHIWYVHEFGDIDHGLQFIAGYKESLGMILECSSRVLTISGAVKSHISQAIPVSKIDIIHQSIDLAALAALPLPNNNGRPLSCLCIGAIKPSKGQLIAVEAIKLANASSSDTSKLSLDIMGPVADRSYYDKIRDMLDTQHITVAEGFCNSLEAFKRHDVVIMCSTNEALGRVTLEALAAGKIVVGYDCPATQELLGNNRGILYSPNSPKALSNILSSLPSIAKRIDRESGRGFVINNYSAHRQAKDFVACSKKAFRDSAYAKSYPSPLRKYLSVLQNRQLVITDGQYYRKRIRTLAVRMLPVVVKDTIKRRARNR